MSSPLSVGYLLKIASTGSPAARLSRITDTMMRVPLTQTLPWQMFGSTLMRSFQFIVVPSVVVPGLLRRPIRGQRTRDGCSLHQSLLPQQLAHRGPVVLPFEQFFPISLGLLPRHEFPERGDVQHDAIVQVGVVNHVRVELRRVVEIQLGGTLQLLGEVLEFDQ